MPLPLLWIGAGLVGAAVTAGHLKEKAKANESKRLTRVDLDSHLDEGKGAAKLPSEILTSDITVTPQPGSIVCCSVFGAFDHTIILFSIHMPV